jgi:ABC-type antimicrobial peptide transport system permease subunit
VFDKLELRIRSVFRWRRVEAELQDELQFHLEQLVKEKAAPEGSILKLVLVQGMWISLAGILAGAIGNLALGKAISTMLYNVEPTDPLTIGAVSILLLLVTVMACYFPARRALRIDPMIALRSE